jgi:hypothetical protein
LTCISFLLHRIFSILIHNQCSDFELVSPAYFGHNVIWFRPPDQKVDANAMTKASFGKNIFEIKFTSALMYKLQRKKRLESNDQSDANNASTENASTSFQLLVIWKSNYRHSARFSIRALLIKHSNTITWDENTLEKVRSMYPALLKDDHNIKDTWLLDDTTVLTTTSNWKKVSCTTKITISEGTQEDDSMDPLWVSSSM